VDRLDHGDDHGPGPARPRRVPDAHVRPAPGAGGVRLPTRDRVTRWRSPARHHGSMALSETPAARMDDFDARSLALERALVLDTVRVTEQAAIAASRVAGKGDSDLVDQAGTDAMRAVLNELEIDGEIVIGEGERD